MKCQSASLSAYSIAEGSFCTTLRRRPKTNLRTRSRPAAVIRDFQLTVAMQRIALDGKEFTT